MGADPPAPYPAAGAAQPPPTGAVTAPAGYTAYSPAAGGAGPSAAAAGYPPQGPPATGGAPYAMPPDAAKPGAYPPQQYPQQQQGPVPPGYPGYAPGVAPPVAGYPVGGPAPMGVAGPPLAGGGVPPGQEKCGCTIGWVLFAFGWLLWPCWVAAAFVPLCTKSRSDRLAGIASTGALLALCIVGIIIGATSPRWRYAY